MLHRRFPSHVYFRMIDRTDFVKVPAFEGVQNGSCMTCMYAATLHCHFACSEVFSLLWHGKGGEFCIDAIGSCLFQRRYYKLMKRGTRRRNGLLLGTAISSDNPLVTFCSKLHSFRMVQQGRRKLVRISLDLLESLLARCHHDDLYSSFSEVQANRPAQF